MSNEQQAPVTENNQAQTQPQTFQPTIVINNNNSNVNAVPVVPMRKKSKVVALLLCIFLGVLGAHKFYEGKVGMGILYIITGGLFLIGWIVPISLFAPQILTIGIKSLY